MIKPHVHQLEDLFEYIKHQAFSCDLNYLSYIPLQTGLITSQVETQ